MRWNKRFVLASKSPRRVKLLNQIGIRAEVIPGNASETFDPRKSPEENVQTVALRKAHEVGGKIHEAIVVGADTVVVLDGLCLQKPAGPEEAGRMLKMLSGRTHTVLTGFALLDRPSGYSVTDYEATRVTFRDLADEEINDYVASGSPLDKAGAYGIQDDFGAVFVTRVDGCFYNVVGFPLSKFYTTLVRFQLELPEQQRSIG